MLAAAADTSLCHMPSGPAVAALFALTLSAPKPVASRTPAAATALSLATAVALLLLLLASPGAAVADASCRPVGPTPG